MLDPWNPYQGPDAGRGKLGKLENRATGWHALATGAQVAYQTDIGGAGTHELTIGCVLVHDKALKAQRLVVVQPVRGDWR
eukprot:15477670-Alexandrium_andersonii.AAC.1